MKFREYLKEGEKLPKGYETFSDKGTSIAYMSGKTYKKNTKPIDRKYQADDNEYLTWWNVPSYMGSSGWSFQGKWTKKEFKKAFGFNP